MQNLKFRKKTKKKIEKAECKERRYRKRNRSRRKKGGIKLYFPKEKLQLEGLQTKEILRWGIEIAAVCLLALTLVLFFGQRVSNAGDSMSPALKNGDILL